MIQISASPGPQLRAQLVGLGYYPSISSAVKSPLPPELQTMIQQAAAGSSTTVGQPGQSAADPNAGATTSEAPADTNWLLWGGVGVGVLLLGLLIIRR